MRGHHRFINVKVHGKESGAESKGSTTVVTFRQLTPAIGAEVRDIDLRFALVGEIALIKEALLEHQVLFFRDQEMDVDQQIEFARNFGEIDVAPVRTAASPRREVLVLDQVAPKGEGADSWHSDNTYLAEPPKASILQALALPPVGGDTCFASAYAAYDALSPTMQAFVDQLTAVHSFQMMVPRISKVASASYLAEMSHWPPAVHPVVRVHPETGRKLLNVNSNWTSHVVELESEESNALLSLLFRHLARTEFQVRFHWEVGSVAVWDNRVVQHYAVADYTERRTMRRVTISGDRPVGTGALAASRR